MSGFAMVSENVQKWSFSDHLEHPNGRYRLGWLSNRSFESCISGVGTGVFLQLFVDSKQKSHSFQKLKERMKFLNHLVCAGQYHAWLIVLGMVAYHSNLLLYWYILLVTELFSFPGPLQSWNRLWMCVGQGEGKLRVIVSLYSGAFSISIKLATFRLPVG